jgi:hypothetical protein
VDGWPRLTTYPRGLSKRFGRSASAAAWQWPAGPRPAFSASSRELVLSRGTLARQTGTTRFTAHTTIQLTDRHARPGLAVTGSEGNAVGVELRGAQAVSWRSANGRRRVTGVVRLPPGRPVAGDGRIRLRVAVGDRVRVAIRLRGRWRSVGRLQPPPRWASGARLALTVRARGRTARFEPPAMTPR